MNPTPAPRKRPGSEFLLLAVLRYIGTVSLLSAVAVFMPYEWMDRIHQGMGLGVLPDEPIVGYLARTLSAFYTLLGGLLWVVSFDLHRHRQVLIYLGVAFVVFGVIAMWVDFQEGMPLFWRMMEAPVVVLFGTTIFLLSRRLCAASPNKSRAGSGNART